MKEEVFSEVLKFILLKGDTLDIRIMKQVPKVIFGRGSFKKLPEVLVNYRSDGYIIFFIDHAHKKTGLVDLIPSEQGDLIFVLNTTSHEPKTDQVDDLRDGILKDERRVISQLLLLE